MYALNTVYDLPEGERQHCGYPHNHVQHGFEWIALGIMSHPLALPCLTLIELQKQYDRDIINLFVRMI